MYKKSVYQKPLLSLGILFKSEERVQVFIVEFLIPTVVAMAMAMAIRQTCEVNLPPVPSLHAEGHLL